MWISSIPGLQLFVLQGIANPRMEILLGSLSPAERLRLDQARRRSGRGKGEMGTGMQYIPQGVSVLDRHSPLLSRRTRLVVG